MEVVHIRMMKIKIHSVFIHYTQGRVMELKFEFFQFKTSSAIYMSIFTKNILNPLFIVDFTPIPCLGLHTKDLSTISLEMPMIHAAFFSRNCVNFLHSQMVACTLFVLLM
jgi:hypothetical protein